MSYDGLAFWFYDIGIGWSFMEGFWFSLSDALGCIETYIL